MTDEELRGLAKDLYEGRVFTSIGLRDMEEINRVFMPLLFMRDLDFSAEVSFVYEYLYRSGPAINGKPCFMSFQVVLKRDQMRLAEYLKGYGRDG